MPHIDYLTAVTQNSNQANDLAALESSLANNYPNAHERDELKQPLSLEQKKSLFKRVFRDKEYPFITQLLLSEEFCTEDAHFNAFVKSAIAEDKNLLQELYSTEQLKTIGNLLILHRKNKIKLILPDDDILFVIASGVGDTELFQQLSRRSLSSPTSQAAILAACKYNQLDILKRILFNTKAAPQFMAQEALPMACQYGHIPLVEWFIVNNPEIIPHINQEEKNVRNPLVVARNNNQPGVVDYLESLASSPFCKYTKDIKLNLIINADGTQRRTNVGMTDVAQYLSVHNLPAVMAFSNYNFTYDDGRAQIKHSIVAQLPIHDFSYLPPGLQDVLKGIDPKNISLYFSTEYIPPTTDAILVRPHALVCPQANNHSPWINLEVNVAIFGMGEEVSRLTPIPNLCIHNGCYSSGNGKIEGVQDRRVSHCFFSVATYKQLGKQCAAITYHWLLNDTDQATIEKHIANSDSLASFIAAVRSDESLEALVNKAEGNISALAALQSIMGQQEYPKETVSTGEYYFEGARPSAKIVQTVTAGSSSLSNVPSSISAPSALNESSTSNASSSTQTKQREQTPLGHCAFKPLLVTAGLLLITVGVALAIASAIGIIPSGGVSLGTLSLSYELIAAGCATLALCIPIASVLYGYRNQIAQQINQCLLPFSAGPKKVI